MDELAQLVQHGMIQKCRAQIDILDVQIKTTKIESPWLWTWPHSCGFFLEKVALTQPFSPPGIIGITYWPLNDFQKFIRGTLGQDKRRQNKFNMKFHQLLPLTHISVFCHPCLRYRQIIIVINITLTYMKLSKTYEVSCFLFS